MQDGWHGQAGHGGGKAILRRYFLDRRRALDPSYRSGADAEIVRQLSGLAELSSAAVVAAYHSDGTEPDLSALVSLLLAHGKTVCLPRAKGGADGDYELAPVSADAAGLTPGAYGIMEPPPGVPAMPPGRLRHCLWLVPGVAFSEVGERLGRGKGIYDRLLAEFGGKAVGVFYEAQKAERLPAERHDQSLDLVVTEQRVYGPFSAAARPDGANGKETNTRGVV
jgi:5-formyltetrahydrofolate cyclo-ligase